MLKNSKSGEFAADWQHLHHLMSGTMRQLVSATVNQHAPELASVFYDYMLADEEAKPFLDHDLVNQRLHSSMQGWLRELFSMQQQDPKEIYKHQCHVGVVHARIQIPISLVMRGTRLLKQAITEYLVETELDRLGLVQATRFVSEVMELSMSAMTDSYIINVGKSVRTDESYRMFALGQNMLAERERQRAALSEWAQHILLHLLGDAGTGTPEMKHSEFGMWLQHKASIIFHDAPELERIRGCVEKLERTLLPGLIEKRRNGGNVREAMKQVEADIGEVKFLLTGLFDRFIEVESGRDSLTRLLNRRYLPTILMREVALARRSGMPFAVLLLDIDHFKNINDTYGHDGGDMVLQQASDLVTSSVRVGDFVFRYGGEELLVVLVEIDKKQAQIVAETIRATFCRRAVARGRWQDDESDREHRRRRLQRTSRLRKDRQGSRRCALPREGRRAQPLRGGRGLTEERHRFCFFACALERRQALPDALAVVFADETRVADHQHAAVVLVADQPSRTLLQVDDGARQLEFHERVASLFVQFRDASRQHRIIRRRERQLVDDDQRQRLAAHIHPFPERLAAQQHRVAVLAEAREQLVARTFALDHQRVLQVLAVELGLQDLVGALHRAQAGEEQEGAAFARFDQGQRRLHHGIGVALAVRLRQVVAARTAMPVPDS